MSDVKNFVDEAAANVSDYRSAVTLLALSYVLVLDDSYGDDGHKPGRTAIVLHGMCFLAKSSWPRTHKLDRDALTRVNGAALIA